MFFQSIHSNYEQQYQLNFLSNLFFLQAAYSTYPAFALFDPFALVSDYDPKLSLEDLALIQCKDVTQLRFLVLAIIPEQLADAYVNLKSPIVINSDNNMAMQIILENNSYPLRYPIFSTEGGQ